MTHDEQLQLCTCGYCELETMNGLLAALAKVEALHQYLPQQHLRGLGAIAIDARGAELICERRECVMAVVDRTTIALCDGDTETTELVAGNAAIGNGEPVGGGGAHAE